MNSYRDANCPGVENNPEAMSWMCTDRQDPTAMLFSWKGKKQAHLETACLHGVYPQAPASWEEFYLETDGNI